ncbi:MAG: AsmA family protein [Candidatus Omnitrophica bacterium]|nr:AsmA family protein [Candidatus Omnitrophota bacterium]
MKRKIIVIAVILFILFSSAIIYLNRVILPTKIKSLIIRGIEDATQKKVSLESLKFSIFKGLVLTNLNIYDDTRTILSLKEGSCTFLMLPFLKKQIIIPGIRLKSPILFVERGADNSFNILKPFLQKEVLPDNNNRFRVLVRKISITKAHIDFQDDTLNPALSKQIDDLNLILSLSLPAKAKFNLNCKILTELPIKIESSGEYNILENELAAKVIIKDFSADEFLGYYQNLGFTTAIKGKIDCLMNLNLKDKILNIDFEAQGRGLNISKEKMVGNLNAQVRADISYSLKNKQLDYSGIMDISDSDISGLEFIDKLEDVKGEVKFSKLGLSCDKISASVLGIPLEAKAKIDLADSNNPLLNADIVSSFNLNVLAAILKDKFKVNLFSDIQGKGDLFLGIQSKIQAIGSAQITGVLNIIGGLVKLEKTNSVFESINGKINFAPNQLSWSDLNLKYADISYKTSGTLTDFASPKVNLNLVSQDLNLDTNFTINEKRINLSKLAGEYINSKFSLSGDINIAQEKGIDADIDADLSVNLIDLKVPLRKFKEKLEQIKPSGILQATGKISGNINDIKTCVINAKFSSSSLSAYGLKATDFIMSYRQAGGITDITEAHLSLYGGSIDAVAQINLASDNLPYAVSTDIRGVKIEELKKDTPANTKDIAGTIQAQAKINGFLEELSKLNGSGKVLISEGKLWQLNLFQGLGSLLFSKDFSNIMFTEGSCDFVIQDKYIFTDNLQLKSNIADLSGAVTIGFDNSIEGELNVKVLDENAPFSGTLKDITTAIIGEAGRFGAIKISGTLKQPRFKFQTAVLDILKGFKDSLFKSQ